jgi:uncharacterized protein (TIGR00297 family)
MATAWGMGWRGVLLLLAFLVSGSLLTKGGGARTARQVVANGGVAALAALAGSWPAFAGSLAAATADTWASEIGRHSRTPPRLITTGMPVSHGTDGGITVLGTAGGIIGAGMMAALAFLLRPLTGVPIAVAVAGVVGMFLDSVLGATLQGKEAFQWLDNDAVNLAATLGGAAVGAVGWQLCC